MYFSCCFSGSMNCENITTWRAHFATLNKYGFWCARYLSMFYDNHKLLPPKRFVVIFLILIDLIK